MFVRCKNVLHLVRQIAVCKCAWRQVCIAYHGRYLFLFDEIQIQCLCAGCSLELLGEPVVLVGVVLAAGVGAGVTVDSLAHLLEKSGSLLRDGGRGLELDGDLKIFYIWNKNISNLCSPPPQCHSSRSLPRQIC